MCVCKKLFNRISLHFQVLEHIPKVSFTLSHLADAFIQSHSHTVGEPTSKQHHNRNLEGDHFLYWPKCNDFLLNTAQSSNSFL